MSGELSIVLEKLEEMKCEMNARFSSLDEKNEGFQRTLNDVQTRQAEMQVRLEKVEKTLDKVQTKQSKMQETLDEVQKEQAAMRSFHDEMQTFRTDVRKELERINITLENDISRKIDVIGEGHDFLVKRLDEALVLERDKERMELEILNLKMDVRKIKEKIEIA